MKLPSIQELIQNPKCAVFCSHSGGKDSQAMYNFIKNLVPKERLFIIHADLGRVEWQGTKEHIKNTIDPDHHFFVVKSNTKTFLSMVEARGMWPSAKYRQCTSDLKTGPIRSLIKRICNQMGFDMVLDCVGIRAAESGARAKKDPYRWIKRECNTKRSWIQWMPIFDWSTQAVFDYIESCGQHPHWAYKAGMTRLSCSFCIMASKSDLMTAARLRPDLLQEYVALEKKINHTFITPRKGQQAQNLDEYLGLDLCAAVA